MFVGAAELAGVPLCSVSTRDLKILFGPRRSREPDFLGANLSMSYRTRYPTQIVKKSFVQLHSERRRQHVKL